MIRAIIFDCFGVLIGQGFDATWRRAGGNPEHDRKFIRDLLGAASLGIIDSAEMTRRICNQLGIDASTWQSVVARSEQPDDELVAYIADTLQKHFKIGMLSNANRGVLERRFTEEQLGVFDAVVISAEVGMVKPDPRIYALAAERLGVSMDECVFIDDNHMYCEAARAAGMQAIKYQHFGQLRNELAPILRHV